MNWETATNLISYPDALARMAERVGQIQRGEAGELAWMVQHPPLYTAGTSTKHADFLGGTGFPVYETGRGGQYTYHGPGQRVVYLMLDLKQRAAARETAPDLRAYVKQLERWIIVTLAEFGVEGFTRDGRIGVWAHTACPALGNGALGEIDTALARSGDLASHEPAPRRAGLASMAMPGATKNGEAKIAALGVRVQKWVTSHGIAINVNPDLSHYAGIVPCGIREFGVTSLAALGVDASMDEVDAVLRTQFSTVFGASRASESSTREEARSDRQ